METRWRDATAAAKYFDSAALMRICLNFDFQLAEIFEQPALGDNPQIIVNPALIYAGAKRSIYSAKWFSHI